MFLPQLQLKHFHVNEELERSDMILCGCFTNFKTALGETKGDKRNVKIHETSAGHYGVRMAGLHRGSLF